MTYLQHARRHLPGGTDPLPGLDSPTIMCVAQFDVSAVNPISAGAFVDVPFLGVVQTRPHLYPSGVFSVDADPSFLDVSIAGSGLIVVSLAIATVSAGFTVEIGGGTVFRPGGSVAMNTTTPSVANGFPFVYDATGGLNLATAGEQLSMSIQVYQSTVLSEAFLAVYLFGEPLT